MKQTKLMLGDNIKSLQKLPDNSIDSIVTDPPYALNFMNKKWDAEVPSVEFWKEVYRVLKPGGHVLSFGGTRTYHRMVVNIEDAGFEIRDQIQWLYGSGFPKSHNIGKAVDKLEGNEREDLGISPNARNSSQNNDTLYIDKSKARGSSPYEGWGTALKPANEPICVARKPLSEKSVAENVLKWGTGGINIDGCRVKYENGSHPKDLYGDSYMKSGNGKANSELQSISGNERNGVYVNDEGRFPANIILDESAAELLDEQSGVSKSTKANMKSAQSGNSDGRYNWNNGDKNDFESVRGHNDSGGASRFFYIAKVSKKERNMGLDGFEDIRIKSNISGLDDKPRLDGSIRETPIRKNSHPTVKPVQLMAYLCRLVTPENGIVLDPFMGSGSTGIAACLEGFRFVGMEMHEDYFKIASARIENYEKYREFVDKKKK